MLPPSYSPLPAVTCVIIVLLAVTVHPVLAAELTTGQFDECTQLIDDEPRVVFTDSTTVIATGTPLSPITRQEIESWRDQILSKYREGSPQYSTVIWGDPLVNTPGFSGQPTELPRPILGYGMKILPSGAVDQIIWRSASSQTGRLGGSIRDHLYSWAQGSFDDKLDGVVPFEPENDGGYTHVRAIDKITTPSQVAVAWKVTVIDSNEPVGMQIGMHTLKLIMPGVNWTYYALETEIMPIPGYQVFGSGYVTDNAIIRQNWSGDFAAYVHQNSCPSRDTEAYAGIDKVEWVAEDVSYQCSTHHTRGHGNYHYGFQSGGPSFTNTEPNTIMWSLNYHDVDPYAEFRGDYKSAGTVAARTPHTIMPSMNLMTISTSSSFKCIGAVPPHGLIDGSIGLVLLTDGGIIR